MGFAHAILLGTVINVTLCPVNAQITDTNRPSPVIKSDEARAQAKKIAMLIDQLGASEFQERERASAQLMQLGEVVLIPLQAAELGTDVEVSQRAHAIRERIELAQLVSLSEEFKRDPDPTKSYGLPGWKSFSKMAGSSRAAKGLFLEMVEKQRTVALCIEAIDGGDVNPVAFEGLPADPQHRLWTVSSKMCQDIRMSLVTAEGSAGDMAALLTVATVLKERPQDLNDTIRRALYRGAFERMKPKGQKCVRQMLGKWVLIAPESMAEDVFMMAHQLEVPEGADMARRVLDQPAEPEVIAKALICLSKFGDQRDLARIDHHVSNTFILNNLDEFREERAVLPFRPANDRNNPSNPSANPPRRYQQTLGDIALAVGLKLAGADLTKYFPVIATDSKYGLRETTICFPVEQPQYKENALKAWQTMKDPSRRVAFFKVLGSL